ncbi:MAG: hypothetical protein J6S04_07165 [Clostridia bacterium]|nr:hypothetical protein [Clostridia bacterium]
MKRKFISGSLALIVALGCMAGCGVEVGPTEKDNISYLYVSTNSGGFGKGFLEVVEAKFEEKYAQTPFAEGKMGVDVVVDQASTNSGGTLINNIANSSTNVFVVEGMYTTNYVAKNYLYDLSELVSSALDDGKTLESKMFNDQKAALKAINDKYYSLPVFAGFNGVTYDKALFADNDLYFADANGFKPYTTSTYTGVAYTGRGFVSAANTKKSPGPDGKYDSYDDGLPSSYEEFFYLLERMSNKSIVPFIWGGGANTHYQNYLFQSLLMCNSSKTELSTNFTFNSGDEEIEIIKSFDSDGNPEYSYEKINDDNGYLITQSSNKYQALKFLQNLFKNSKYYHSDSVSGNLTNAMAQKVYEESSLIGNTPIAMLIEGNYWCNEAAAELKESEQYPNGKNRQFAYMPLPAVENGTINENEGNNIALADCLDYYLVVNNNIAKNKEKKQLAEAFVKMMYSDECLQAMTAEVGVPFALKYEMGESYYNQMSVYEQSVWDIYDFSKDNDAYVTPQSANEIFLSNTARFSFKTTQMLFHTYIDGIEYSVPYQAFSSAGKGASAREYFVGMAVSLNDWSSKYNTKK